MTPSVILGIIATILILVATVASAVAVAKASLSKSTIETLRASNDALGERVELLVKQVDGLRVSHDKLAAENEVLRTLKSGADAVDRLGEKIISNVEKARHDHHDILAMIEAIASTLAAGQQSILDGQAQLLAFLEETRGKHDH